MKYWLTQLPVVVFAFGDVSSVHALLYIWTGKCVKGQTKIGFHDDANLAKHPFLKDECEHVSPCPPSRSRRLLTPLLP
jgi:hypothetical protein